MSGANPSSIWEITEASAAAAGVLVNGIGLLLIRQQLVQTRSSLTTAAQSADAAARAARIAFQQSRPWIKLSLVRTQADIYFTPGEPDHPQITVEVQYENVGQTPALAHTLVTRGIRDPHLSAGALVRETWQEILSTDWGPQTSIFPGQVGQMGCGTWLPWPEDVETGTFAVLVAALYKSAMDEPWHGTPLVVLLHGPQPTGQPVRAPRGQSRRVTLTSSHNYGTFPI